MIAISIALVLCCAMVCGTRVYLRRVDTSKSHSDALGSRLDALGSRVEASFRALDELGADVDRRCGHLQSDVDVLKANAAFRSLGHG